MNTNTAITVICFSPTHTSRKIAEAVAAGMDGIYCGSGEGTGVAASCPGTVKTIDLTLDRSEEPVILAQGEAVVIGAPSRWASSRSPPEPSSESTATAPPRCLLPKDVPIPWTWPMPASSEESAPANWKALEHSHLSTSRETVRTKSLHGHLPQRQLPSPTPELPQPRLYP